MTELKTKWHHDSIFYHLYPLGVTGAPHSNDMFSREDLRLESLACWIPHISDMGFNAVYLGPVFESCSHGYDTVDYYRVDRRLGNNESLKKLVSRFHKKGIRVVLDGVFNHVGRGFQPFQDLRVNGRNSRYGNWFSGVNFHGNNSFGDPFCYDNWNGYEELVKLNLNNGEVNDYLLQAVKYWTDYFNIDGIRLDAADHLDRGFQRRLGEFCRKLRPDFWLMGEVVHGNYRDWIDNGMDSTTNYECYKGLYSSHNDNNYFEIAYSLNRQFGRDGIYKGLLLYAFAENHDVERVFSKLHNKAHVYPLYCILFSMPGVPSVYYGGEWGIEGRKGSDDWPLRPPLTPDNKIRTNGGLALEKAIRKLIAVRKSSDALKYGDYKQLLVNHNHFAFRRRIADETAAVFISSEPNEITVRAEVDLPGGTVLKDLLNPGDSYEVRNGRLEVNLYPNWGRILVTGRGKS